MKEKEFHIPFPVFGRNCIEEKLITQCMMNVWDEITSTISSFTIHTDDKQINVSIDWGMHLNTIKEKIFTDAMSMKEYIKNNHNFLDEENSSDEYLELVCRISCRQLDELNSQASDIELKYYLENTFYHVFLMINLSAPGAFNPYSPFLKSRENLGLELYKLSSFDFENSWINSIEVGWPSISYIPFPKVWAWYSQLNIGTRQIASTRLERALFSLLHCSLSEGGISPTDLIWVSHALESLYDTPNGLINRILVDRISMFLELPLVNSRKLKKKIRDFYEIRSRFVHGELDISHPTNNDILDKSLDSYTNNLLENYYFGFSIVLATIQKMIANNWNEIRFSENYTGV
ncbi:hypothetical protein NSQ38_28220 [Paenibacillus sp. FSL R7-0313]|uniref:hypothetical protein n=1 Tax=Paenibacillus sp. FSL R7-0313 TaxID=2954532 RepID=UPI0030DAC5B6